MGVELRCWREEEYVEFYQCTRRERIQFCICDSFPNTVSQCKDMTARYARSDSKQCCRAIIIDGQIVGCIGIKIGDGIHSRSAELFFWLCVGQWESKYLVVTIRLFYIEIFREYTIVRIFARPFVYDSHCREVLVKVGFVMEGTMRMCVFKDNKYHDVCMYALYK